MKLPIDLSNVITDRVTYLFTKAGENNMEISGFALASGDFSSAPNINSNDISKLENGIGLSSSDHGGTSGPGKTAVPYSEGTLVTWAAANDWNLIKLDSKGNHEVLNGADLLDTEVITFNDPDYDIAFPLDSGDNYNAGKAIFTDAAGNTETIDLPTQAGVAAYTFTNLVGASSTWSVRVVVVSVNGNYVDETIAAPLTIV